MHKLINTIFLANTLLTAEGEIDNHFAVNVTLRSCNRI